MSHRVLPVVRWLQIGAAAAGLGLGFAAAPAVAWADDNPAPSAADSAGATSKRSGASEGTRRSTIGAGPRIGAASAGDAAKTSSEAEAPRSRRNGSPARVSAQTNVSRGLDLPDVTAPKASATAASAAPAATTAEADAAPSSALVATAEFANAVASNDAPVVSAPAPQAKATAVKTASAAPGLGAFGSALRLNIEDLFTGGAPKVTKPTEVVTGLFQQVLRRDPTTTELQRYAMDLNLFGVNAVVAGLYSSDAFRQNAVANYYRELLGRNPTQLELTTGAFTYSIDSALFNSPESYVASLALAGGKEFYDYSASGGGQYGSKPSATSYVSLLYRSLLGQPINQDAAPLIQSVERGLPTLFAANQFVSSDAYRTVKVGQVLEVLGQSPQPDAVASYVKNWIWNGGQAGISQSLLATSANISRIQAGLYNMPDVASGDLLTNILLLPYGNKPGTLPTSPFVDAMKQQLQAGGTSAEGKLDGCKGTQSKCNVPFFTLMTTGGNDRGIPNNALQWTKTPVYMPVNKIIPTQSNVDMDQSLQYPLRQSATLSKYLKGGNVETGGGTILTADGGQYVIDGHHRWSALYVINPNNTAVKAFDLGYVPNPQTALKETQVAVANLEGYLPWRAVEGPNLYTVDEQTFKAKAFEYIWAEEIPTAPPLIRSRETDTDALSAGYMRPVTFNMYREYLTGSVVIPGVPQGALTPEQAIDYSQPILEDMWKNVQQMRKTNQPIPDATPRADMPQPEDNDYERYFPELDTGKVIYSLPTISALG